LAPDIGREAREVIRRLAEVDPTADVRLDKPKAEAALDEFLRRLGLTPRPVLWAAGPADAVKLVEKHRGSLSYGYLNAVPKAGSVQPRCSSQHAALEAAREAARSPVWNALESDIRRHVGRDSWKSFEEWARASSGHEAWYFHLSAVAGAVRSAGEFARVHETVRDPKAAREFSPSGLPLLDAYEAGLWFYWVTRVQVLAMPRPAVRLREGRLHGDGVPAADWGRERVYFLNGVHVPKEIALTPAHQLDPKLVHKVRNVEVRRELVRKVGVERVVTELGAVRVDREGDYELLLLDLGDGRRRPFLKMRNPSVGVFHVEGVHPDCRTVREALAWRNGTDTPPSVLT
jgi:hypothetical protein